LRPALGIAALDLVGAKYAFGELFCLCCKKAREVEHYVWTKYEQMRKSLRHQPVSSDNEHTTCQTCYSTDTSHDKLQNVMTMFFRILFHVQIIGICFCSDGLKDAVSFHRTSVRLHMKHLRENIMVLFFINTDIRCLSSLESEHS